MAVYLVHDSRHLTLHQHSKATQNVAVSTFTSFSIQKCHLNSTALNSTGDQMNVKDTKERVTTITKSLNNIPFKDCGTYFLCLNRLRAGRTGWHSYNFHAHTIHSWSVFEWYLLYTIGFGDDAFSNSQHVQWNAKSKKGNSTEKR